MSFKRLILIGNKHMHMGKVTDYVTWHYRLKKVNNEDIRERSGMSRTNRKELGDGNGWAMF